jgi:protein-disulfide isomerase
MPPRPKPKPQGPSRRDRSRFDSRLLIVLGAGLLVGVVAVVLSFTLGHSSSKTPTEVTADFSSVAGIPQRGLVLGNPDAKVGLTEYVDTSCPICRQYVLDGFPAISRQYIRSGKVKADARVLAFVGPSSPRGRELVLAAAQQNKAWQLAELLYQNQGPESQDWLTDSLAHAIAAKIPDLNVDKLFADASGSAEQAAAKKADAQATADRIAGTPTFIVTTKSGQRVLVTGSLPDALDQALAD